MKLLVSLSFIMMGIMSFGQKVDQAEVNKIIGEIVAPLGANDIDKVLSKTVFPFKVGDKKYTRATLKADFDKVFVGGLRSELKHASAYEAINFDGDAYMMVCSSAPEGYEAAVPVFKKIDGTWMLSSIDLYIE